MKFFKFIVLLLISFFSCTVIESNELKEIVFVDLPGVSVYATSVLDNSVKYHVENLFDKNVDSVWVEGKSGDGIGESIYFTIPEDVHRIRIFSGHWKSKQLFYKNNRPKKIKFNIYVGINPEGYVSENTSTYFVKAYKKTFISHLEDNVIYHDIELPFDKEELSNFKNKVISQFKKEHTEAIAKITYIIQATIEDIYKGTKYNDTCISEIVFNRKTYIHNKYNEKYKTITRIYESTDGHSIFIDSDSKKRIPLLQDREFIFTILDTTDNNEWVIIEKAPSQISGRVETEHLLINTKTGNNVSDEIKKFNNDKIEFINFEKKGPHYYIDIGVNKKMVLEII